LVLGQGGISGPRKGEEKGGRSFYFYKEKKIETEVHQKKKGESKKETSRAEAELLKRKLRKSVSKKRDPEKEKLSKTVDREKKGGGPREEDDRGDLGDNR